MKILRFIAVLAVAVLSILVSAAPVMAGPPEKDTTIVAPEVGKDHIVKTGREAKLVPDKSGKPPHGNQAYQDVAGEPYDPTGTVFWGNEPEPEYFD